MDSQQLVTVLVALIGTIGTVFGAGWNQARADKQRSLDREAETERLASQRAADEKRWADQRAEEALLRAEERAHLVELARAAENRELRDRRDDVYKRFLTEVERIRVMQAAPDSAADWDEMKTRFYDHYNEVLLVGAETLSAAEQILPLIEQVWVNRQLGDQQGGPPAEDLRMWIDIFRQDVRREIVNSYPSAQT